MDRTPDRHRHPRRLPRNRGRGRPAGRQIRPLADLGTLGEGSAGGDHRHRPRLRPRTRRIPPPQPGRLAQPGRRHRHHHRRLRRRRTRRTALRRRTQPHRRRTRRSRRHRYKEVRRSKALGILANPQQTMDLYATAETADHPPVEPAETPADLDQRDHRPRHHRARREPDTVRARSQHQGRPKTQSSPLRPPDQGIAGTR